MNTSIIRVLKQDMVVRAVIRGSMKIGCSRPVSATSVDAHLGSMKFCLRKQANRSCSEHFPHPQRLSQGHLSPVPPDHQPQATPTFIFLVSQTKRIAHCEVSCGLFCFILLCFWRFTMHCFCAFLLLSSIS